jgi:hypothetical protein
MSIVMILALAAVAGANQWNDRTTLKFDTPIMVPGATLAPGTYVFKLMDSATNRHMVQIFKEEGNQLIATTQAVPIKRMEAKGDVVLKLNPTEASAPVAIKAWFYPGSLYGHQFVYPDRQAREIAQRTKTLVLSGDIPDSDMQKGTLHTYDATGGKQPWRADEQTMKEWKEWTDQRAASATARVAAPGTADTRESTAPMVRSQPAGMKVSVGDLEENPKRYIGQTINVTAEVEDVFGPRLFKIDEPNWGDMDGEVLVYLPSDLAALVREDDRVTITGTMKMFLKADLEREFGWLEPEPDVEIEFADRPVLVASRIVGGNSDVALAIKVNPAGSASGKAGESTVGTTGKAGGEKATPLTDAAALAEGDRDLVGRRVDLDNVKVNRSGKNRGFWIDAGGHNVFVLPARYTESKTVAPTPGQTMSIEGVVFEMPRSMRENARDVSKGNADIYVFATTVK